MAASHEQGRRATALRTMPLVALLGACTVVGSSSGPRAPSAPSLPSSARTEPLEHERPTEDGAAVQPSAASAVSTAPPREAVATFASEACFAGRWVGHARQGTDDSSFKISITQVGADLRGVFEWRQFSHETTEPVTGTSDCARGTATLLGGDGSSTRYTLTLSPDVARMTDGRSESRFDGAWSCGADCDGQLTAYRQNPN